jgi:hypothetical protein
VDEFLCVTIVSNAGEAQADFNKRLISFWSHMLRNHEADYECVYAESTRFGTVNDRISRQYFIAVDAIDAIREELTKAGLTLEPFDRDDTYSRYEATPPDWFQLEH